MHVVVRWFAREGSITKLQLQDPSEQQATSDLPVAQEGNNRACLRYD